MLVGEIEHFENDFSPKYLAESLVLDELVLLTHVPLDFLHPFYVAEEGEYVRLELLPVLLVLGDLELQDIRILLYSLIEHELRLLIAAD